MSFIFPRCFKHMIMNEIVIIEHYNKMLQLYIGSIIKKRCRSRGYE